MTIASTIFKLIKQKFVYVGVPVIIVNSKGEILLGKRGKEMVAYPSMWGLPGGMPEYGEKLSDAAKREVKEELGVDVEIIKKGKNSYENPPSKECKFHSVDIIFYGKIINGTPKAKDETSEIKWFKPSEIKEMKLAYGHKRILEGEGIIK